jgi:hypothetical protein
MKQFRFWPMLSAALTLGAVGMSQADPPGAYLCPTFSFTVWQGGQYVSYSTSLSSSLSGDLVVTGNTLNETSPTSTTISSGGSGALNTYDYTLYGVGFEGYEGYVDYPTSGSSLNVSFIIPPPPYYGEPFSGVTAVSQGGTALTVTSSSIWCTPY